MTPPYFHDGSVATLPQAVRVMAHVQLGVTLNDTDTRDIMAFLESLTGAAGELRQGPGPSARHLVTSRKRDRREAAQLMLWFLQRNPVQVPFNGGSGALTLVSESESEWLYSIVDTLRKGQANLLMRSCTE